MKYSFMWYLLCALHWEFGNDPNIEGSYSYGTYILIWKYSGALVLIVSSFPDSWRVLNPTCIKWWNIFSCGTVSWLIPVLANPPSPKQVPSAATFFAHQNGMSTGVDKFWSQRVPRYNCVVNKWIKVVIWKLKDKGE